VSFGPDVQTPPGFDRQETKFTGCDACALRKSDLCTGLSLLTETVFHGDHIATATLKIRGNENLAEFTGQAFCFNDEQDAIITIDDPPETTDQ
jgi:hypothetical protein